MTTVVHPRLAGTFDQIADAQDAARAALLAYTEGDHCVDDETGAWSVSCRCCYCRALYALWLQDEHTAPTGTFELAVPPPTRVAEEIPCSRRLR